MNAQQEAKLSMYLSTGRHLDDNSTIIAGNAAFVSNFTTVKAKVADLSNKAQLSDLALTGLAAGKKNTKQNAAQTAADTAGIVYAFADATANEQLKAEVDYSLTDLLKMKDSLLALRCRNIHDLAVENKTALVDYGVTDAALTDLQTAIDDYTATITKPRAARSGRKTLNAEIAGLFKEIDKIYDRQLDKLIVAFKTAHPDFVQTYFNLRKLPEPPVTATQLKGVVTNASDETPIKDALVTVVELGKTAKTKSSGEYLFKPIPNGTYTIRVTAEGFQDFESQEIEVKLGQINTLDISLLS